ncbi:MULTISPECIES: GNAT family N-acetyltransferase [Frankia]|uniref:Acetyltransferase protein n=1 Tax=Frankia alni (strain DSM 45986 / CECT 9034 / ACN14a) TaxID=326424 RepID=Q0RFR1_FRAAA|nr:MULTISPECIES: GNAT family N-acetyltransferase [Frankia]CAJ63680.1 Putative acetyltransferase protein [Frankia alni ACN14a]
MTLDIAESLPAVMVPTVRTERLILRGWTAGDIPAYTRMALDPRMSRYTGSPSSEGAVWNMFALQIGHWALNGFGMWLAHERATGEFIGRAGLYREYGWPGLEAAWTIRPQRWGEGFATEGGAAAVEYAFTGLRADRVISIIHPENAASIRVAVKLGMTFAEATERNGQPRHIYAISRPDWRPSTAGSR